MIQLNNRKNANSFKNFYSKLARWIQEYYSSMNIPLDSFKIRYVKRDKIHKVLSNLEISGRFLKDGADFLAELKSKTVNISLSSKYRDKCKTAKVKPLYKKGINTETKNTDLFLYYQFYLKFQKEFSITN